VLKHGLAALIQKPVHLQLPNQLLEERRYVAVKYLWWISNHQSLTIKVHSSKKGRKYKVCKIH